MWKKLLNNKASVLQCRKMLGFGGFLNVLLWLSLVWDLWSAQKNSVFFTAFELLLSFLGCSGSVYFGVKRGPGFFGVFVVGNFRQWAEVTTSLASHLFNFNCCQSFHMCYFFAFLGASGCHFPHLNKRNGDSYLTDESWGIVMLMFVK